MSLRSTLSQNRLGKGNDSRDGGVVVRDGATGGLGGLLPTLVPVVFMVVVRPLCCVVVVVIAAVVIRGGAGTEVASEIGGAEREVNLVHDDPLHIFLIPFRQCDFHCQKIPDSESGSRKKEQYRDISFFSFLFFFFL